VPLAPLITGGLIGLILGGWFVLRWGLWARKPQWWDLEQCLIFVAVIAAVLAGSRVLGVDREYWLAFGIGFPLGLLPMVSVALSAHTYTGQSVALSATCGYLGVLQSIYQSPSVGAVQFLMAGVFVALPALFAWQGLLGKVQAWNTWFWQKIRQLFGLPQSEDTRP
jgi:hypothetical protein